MRRRIARCTFLVSLGVGSLLTAQAAKGGYQFVRTIATQGPTPYAQGVAAGHGNVYVAVNSPTFPNRTAQVFTSEGTYLGNAGMVDSAVDVTVDRLGNFYLADALGNIQGFTSSRNYFTSIPTWLAWPSGGSSNISADYYGTVWATSYDGEVARFSSSGQLLSEFTIPGVTGSTQRFLTGLATDPLGFGFIFAAVRDGSIGGDDQIMVFDYNGDLLNQFGASGSGNGQLDLWGPSGVAVDSSLRVYVADSGNSRVQVFDGWTGQYLDQFGSAGSGNGQFNYPTDVAVDFEGKNVWVSDFYNFRVQHFLIPEPSTAVLLGAGSIGLFWVRRFRRGPHEPVSGHVRLCLRAL